MLKSVVSTSSKLQMLFFKRFAYTIQYFVDKSHQWRQCPQLRGLSLLLFYYSQANFPVSAFQRAMIHLCEVIQGEKNPSLLNTKGEENWGGVEAGSGWEYGFPSLCGNQVRLVCGANFQSSGHEEEFLIFVIQVSSRIHFEYLLYIFF